MEIFLLIVALPLSSELVFRGLLLPELSKYLGAAAAVAVTTLLFALWWPVLGWEASVIVGIVTSSLYLRTRNIIAPTIANSLATILIGAGAVLLSVWR